MVKVVSMSGWDNNLSEKKAENIFLLSVMKCLYSWNMVLNGLYKDNVCTILKIIRFFIILFSWLYMRVDTNTWKARACPQEGEALANIITLT
jgi:hypothetical protein